MAYTIWMPLDGGVAAGVAADLLNSQLNARKCTDYMRRIVNNFRKFPHLVWWPPDFSHTKTDYNADLVFDAPHFHLQLGRYLMGYPGSAAVLGEKLVDFNTTSLSAWLAR